MKMPKPFLLTSGPNQGLKPGPKKIHRMSMVILLDIITKYERNLTRCYTDKRLSEMFNAKILTLR